MPGMDGFEVPRLIRNRRISETTPIIFITAVDRGDDAIRAGYKLGAVDYMVKPFRPDVLRWKVSVFAELYKSRRKERLYIEEHLRRTEAERAARRSRVFADIATTLASSFEEKLALSDVARHCVPTLADAAALLTIEEDQTNMRLEAVVFPDGSDGLAATIGAIDDHARDPLFRLFADPHAVQIVDFSEDGNDTLLSSAHRRLAEQLNAKSGLFVPILGRSATLGIIALY